ncbi:ATP-binding protein [Mariprofundus ferrooxydans]|uniref:ATP-binding protein n=1 Tax=Mariprofundus ferrooxydans TaxID=314344 RepID=UPI0006A6F76B|nr:DUF87 domain-containing protein [Mariprofundus ferrooxydans]KON48507.1 hypothetical protein AL013_02445 [Mariprofundus ferrooxydans]
MAEQVNTQYVAPWTRVLILLMAMISALSISYYYTGSIFPNDPKQSLVLQNTLLLVVLGSALLEHHFTKPADSVVNALMGGITLLSVYSIAPREAWWVVFSYCSFVFVVSIACVVSSSGKDTSGLKRTVSDITYRPSVLLGRAKLLYSIIFLFGLYAFFEIQSPQTIALVLFWGLFIVIWPLGVPQFISSFSKGDSTLLDKCGELIRTDTPNLLRFKLDPEIEWKNDILYAYQKANGIQEWVLPLYSHMQNDCLVGTGLSLAPLQTPFTGLGKGRLYKVEKELMPTSEDVLSFLGEAGGQSRLIGFVVEGSCISEINFELWEEESCFDGMLVWCRVGNEVIYYQVTNGRTHEESLETDRHGYQIAVASQLGILSEERGFKQFDWLPSMNTPVFSVASGEVDSPYAVPVNDFQYGSIPHSNISVSGPFTKTFNHHTAILGVTGSGKTELGFELIRHSLSSGIKVICIDLTSQYKGRLSDLAPEDLSISHELATELSDKLFDVDTGQYGAGAEKRALGTFAEELRGDIKTKLQGFLLSSDDKNLGIIQLEEISNSKATLWITELYLSCLLNYARSHIGDSPEVLIVVEEAHTVMPEPSTMGLGDFDSKGLVGKISQIALQGRKYNIGLLVLAQRTATVSKSILTQCNTIISFASYDDTSLGFLKNIFGETHVKAIPNLKPLQAIAFGKGVRSDRPILLEVPYDERKANE